MPFPEAPGLSQETQVCACASKEEVRVCSGASCVSQRLYFMLHFKQRGGKEEEQGEGCLGKQGVGS